MSLLKTLLKEMDLELDLNKNPEVDASVEEPTSTEENPVDVVSVDMPLFIRLLEWAKEDAQTDMDLHAVAAKVRDLLTVSTPLSMDHYEEIMTAVTPEEKPEPEDVGDHEYR